MAEYIERNALIRQIICDMAEFVGTPNEVLKHDERCNYAIFYLKNASIADVVPVVRCKDCKYRDRTTGICKQISERISISRNKGARMKPYDFCSYGERREE